MVWLMSTPTTFLVPEASNMTDVYTRLDWDQRVWSRDCHSDTNLAISKRMMLHITEPSLDHQMFGRPCDISVMGPRMKCSRED